MSRLRKPSDPAPRVAWGVTCAVFAATCLLAALHLTQGTAPSLPKGPATLAGALACLAVLFWLQVVQTYWAGLQQDRSRASYAVLAAQAALVYLPMLHFQQAWLGLLAFVAGSTLLVLPPTLRWFAFAGVAASAGAVPAVAHYGPANIGYGVVATLAFGLAIYGLSRMLLLLRTLHSARRELAEAAVISERLRFARDLHGSLDRSLADIARTLDAVHHLIGRSTDQARSELVQALAAARRALADARSTAHGYREPALPDDGRLSRDEGIAPRLAWAICITVFAGVGAARLLFLVQVAADAFVVVTSMVCLAALIGLQILLCRWTADPERAGASYTVLGAQAGLVAVPLLYFQQVDMVHAGFLAAGALLILPSALGWAAFLSVVAGVWLAELAFTGASLLLAFYPIATASTGLIIYGLSRLLAMVRELHSARRELAEAAVIRERLRFARDLHDLLGYSLSTVTLKLELAQRVLDTAPDRARREVEEALSTCRQARADVGTVASGYRELSLEAEYRSIRSALAAAGIALHLRAEHGEVPAEVGTVIATVLREGVTNLLRHSAAGACELTVRHAGGLFTAEVVNDGAHEVRQGPEGGLANLGVRVAALGGTLKTDKRDGSFRVAVALPAEGTHAT